MDISLTEAVLSLLALVVTAAGGFLCSWLRRLSQSEKDRHDMSVLHMLQQQALEVASSVGERALPKIARRIRDGELTDRQAVKAQLYELGGIAYAELSDVVPELVAEVGEAGVRSIIRRAADDVSPFPGKETAEQLLKNPGKLLEGDDDGSESDK